MDFRLSEEQELLVETARALFTKECPADVVRAPAADPGPARELFDKHLRDWVGLAGGSMVDLTLFLTEAGAVVAPGPFLATAGMFAPLLVATGHPLAEAAVNGEITGTVTLPDHGDADAAAKGPLVIDANLVDYVAILTPGPDRRLAVVETGSLELTPTEMFDLGRSFSRLSLASVPTGEPINPAAIHGAHMRATLAVAAESVGVGRWLLEASVAYARERIQFGKPIGVFQAVQHKLVDVALAQQEASAAVSYAAMCIDADDPDRRRATHVAKAMAGIASRKAGRDGLQVHGGVGFTWEHDLHLRLRRAFTNDAIYGTHEWHLDRLADLTFS